MYALRPIKQGWLRAARGALKTVGKDLKTKEKDFGKWWILIQR